MIKSGINLTNTNDNNNNKLEGFVGFVRQHLVDEERDVVRVLDGLEGGRLGWEEQGGLLVRCVGVEVVGWMREVFGMYDDYGGDKGGGGRGVLEGFLKVWGYFRGEDVGRFWGRMEVEGEGRVGRGGGLLPEEVYGGEWVCGLVEEWMVFVGVERDLWEMVGDVRDLDVWDEGQVGGLIRKLGFLKGVFCGLVGFEGMVWGGEVRGKGRGKGREAWVEGLEGRVGVYVARFEELVRQVVRLLGCAGVSEASLAKEDIVECFERLVNIVRDCMRDKKEFDLVVIVECFTIEEQGQIVRRIMKGFLLGKLWEDYVQWLFSVLKEEERKMVMWSLWTTGRDDGEFERVKKCLRTSVRNGMFDAAAWNSLGEFLPELLLEDDLENKEMMVIDNKDGNEEDVSDKDKQLVSSSRVNTSNNTTTIKKNEVNNQVAGVEDGPVREILRIHKAIRVELRQIVAMAKELFLCETLVDTQKVTSLTNRVTFLQRIVHAHSRTEDTVLLPTLEERIPGVTQNYSEDHTKEKERFARLSHKLKRLSDENSNIESCRLARSIRVASKALMDGMGEHLEKEETQLWPLLLERFSVEEQDRVVGRILGMMPSDVLQEMFPWMLRCLEEGEGRKMIGNVLSITKCTMFERWLRSWLPGIGEGGVGGDGERLEGGLVDVDEGVGVERMVDLGELEREVVRVGRDESLSIEERSRVMQRMMLARWEMVRRGKDEEGGGDEGGGVYEEEYVVLNDGRRVFGCKHYQRSCKIVASCCQRLYMCRLCHDERENHAMDRTLTKDMLCLYCKRTGPLGQYCSYENCKKQMAKYYCSICRLFDDDETRSKYHCHSCNICRMGQGLGTDYFHCMICNTCLDIRYENDHKCVENCAKGQCPVCRHELFESVRAVKYLGCGHLMHTDCYNVYTQNSLKCPVCAKEFKVLSEAVRRVRAVTAGGLMGM